LHACKTDQALTSTSGVVPYVINCPYCAKSVSLSLEYADGKIGVKANKTGTLGLVTR